MPPNGMGISCVDVRPAMGTFMIKSIKKLTKHSMVYGVGHILSRSIGFLLLPIHTNCLKADLYGVASLLFSALAIFNVVFSYGMDAAFLRFFILEESRTGRQRIFSTIFWMILATGTVFSLGMLSFPRWFSMVIFDSPQYSTLIRYASCILWADALALIPFLVLRCEEKSGQFVFFKSLNIVLNLGLNALFLIAWHQKLEGVFLANLIASTVTLMFLMPIVFRWLRLSVDFSMLSELMRFGLPYVPSALALVFMDQISRFFLFRMASPEAAGVFSASYKIGMFMSILVAAFRFAWHPFFLSTLKQKDAPQIFARVLTYFSAVMAFFLLAISFFTREIVGFRFAGVSLFGKGYESGIGIVPIVLLAYAFYGIYINQVVGVYVKKKSVYLTYSTAIGALAAVIANALLIPPFGIMGAAWASLLGYASMAMSKYFFNQILYPIPYEIKRLFLLSVLSAVIFVLGYCVLAGHSAFLRLLVLAAWFPLLWISGFMTSGEKDTLLRFVKTRFAR
jgi:O-antigen/teichoic acid export membrane protein